MTLREKQSKFWVMVAKMILKAEELGTPIFIIEWIRTSQQQAINVARGASKTMKSKHLLGLAVDICFLQDVLDDKKVNFPPDKYKPLGKYWESLGGRWGGRFGETKTHLGWDAGHFEVSL